VPFSLLLAGLIIFGFFPRLLTERIKPSAALIVEAAKTKGRPAVASTFELPKNPVLVDAPTPGRGF
jgi:hypothetical protein